jgi:ribonuclease HI
MVLFHHDDHTGDVGAILRDHDGHFIAAFTMYIPNLASAAAAEAMALQEGLSLANHLGYNNVIAESDSIEIIEACTGTEARWGDSSAVLADCVDLMALFGTTQFQHCMRKANGAAYVLAKFFFSDKKSCNWIDQPLSFLLEELVNHVTVMLSYSSKFQVHSFRYHDT